MRLESSSLPLYRVVDAGVRDDDDQTGKEDSEQEQHLLRGPALLVS